MDLGCHRGGEGTLGLQIARWGGQSRFAVADRALPPVLLRPERGSRPTRFPVPSQELGASGHAANRQKHRQAMADCGGRYRGRGQRLRDKIANLLRSNPIDLEIGGIPGKAARRDRHVQGKIERRISGERRRVSRAADQITRPDGSMFDIMMLLT